MNKKLNKNRTCQKLKHMLTLCVLKASAKDVISERFYKRV